jgi:hypothetical protein
VQSAADGVYDAGMQGARSIRGWGVWAAAALCLAPACRREQTPVVGPEAEPARTERPKSARRGPAEPTVAVASSPLQLLPDTTAATFTIAGIGALLAVIDVDAIIGKYRGQYDQLVQWAIAGAGVNLFDPGQWREIGVDPDGPLGGAVLDSRSETYVGFIKLTDPDKFRAFVDRVGGARRLQPVMEDRGLVLRADADSSSALVLRDGFAFLVSTDRPNEAPYDFARLLATIDPARGLTTTPRYQRAIAGGEPGRPLTAYVDLWALMAGDPASHLPRESESSWAEQELARAVETGAPAEEQSRLRQQIDEQRAWERRAAEKREQWLALMKRWLGPLEPLVLEFTASQAGVVGKIRAKLPESARLRAVVRNAATPSPLLTALGERPMVMFGASVDVAEALAEFEQMLRAAGEDPERVYQLVRGQAKLDVKGELAPLLTGSGGFALTISDAAMRGDERPATPGFALALEVKDVAAARALVGRMVGVFERSTQAKLGKDPKTGAHTLAIKDYRVVFATVIAGHIVVTSDAAVLRNLGSGKPDLRRLATAVVPVMTAREAAGQAMFDVVFPLVVLRSGASGMVSESWGAQPYSQFPDVAHAQIDRVQQSPQFKAKLRQWEKLAGKLRKLEEQEERQRMKMMTALADCVGAMAGNLRELPDGLELDGGQFFGKGGLTRAFDLGVEYFGAPRGTEQRWELYGEVSAIEEELRRIRASDVAAALHLPTPVQ